MPGKTLNVRSGLIVGSFDPTDRFTYWVMRTARGGEVLAPGNPNRFVQMIDARDLSEWIIKMVELNETGIYNVDGLPFNLTMGKMLEQIKNVSNNNVAFTWVSEEFLNQEKVAAWSEMPLYLPESQKEFQGFMSGNIDKALQSGLEFRPLHETILDTLNWRKTKNDELKAGISYSREQELLEKWREQ
jgi:2'-hydroxyisoflavone reductase